METRGSHDLTAGDPVSWFVIAPGWKVVDTKGQRVQLKLTKDQVHHLGEFEEPPTSAEILPEGAGAIRRAEASVEAPIQSHEERPNFLTRVVHAWRRTFRR